MVKHLRLFDVRHDDEVVIVRPIGDGSSFRYRDLHIEANSVRDYLMRPQVRHLVIDLEMLQYSGSEFIGALVTMLREVRRRGGMAMFCSARPQMLQVLENMNLFKLWPHHEDLPTALATLPASPAQQGVTSGARTT